MNFGGFQKLTVQDYPGKVACIVFTGGCNFRCLFCHNASLVLGRGEEIPAETILGYLKKRRGILDGVCITGGEPLLHSELREFITDVRTMGYSIKLDTNGSFPGYLRELIDGGLVDYVAMDIKSSPSGYDKVAGIGVPADKIQESIKLIMEGGVDYEFRTTLVRELHTPEDMEEIGRLIQGASRYYLQSFADSGDILGGEFTAFAPEEMRSFRDIARRWVPETYIRGDKED